MRFKTQLRAVLSEDLDQLQRYLDISETVDDTLVTSTDGGVVIVPPSVTNQAVLFPKVTNGKYFLMFVLSGEVQYRVNDVASRPIAIKPNPAATPDPILPYQKQDQPGLVMMGPIGVSAPLMSLFLTNPSSTTPARVQVSFVGEAT